MTLWELTGTPRKQDVCGRVRGTAPVNIAPPLGGDVPKPKRDGNCSQSGMKGSPETYPADLTPVRGDFGLRLARSRTSLRACAAELVGQPDGIPRDRPW